MCERRWPGPWPSFDGIGADRLVVGKPGCAGCAGSNYFDAADMDSLFTAISKGTLTTHSSSLPAALFLLFTAPFTKERVSPSEDGVP